MEHSLTSVGQLPLDEFVRVVAKIYSVHDKHRSIWDVWCHTLHHAAGIAQQVRAGTTQGKLYEEIADVSLWLFTAILKLNRKLGQSEGASETAQESVIRIASDCSDLLWHKYPNLCPKCSADRIVGGFTGSVSLGLTPCGCLTAAQNDEGKDDRRRRLERLRSYSDSVNLEKPSSIDGWQRMFGAIFGANLRRLSLAQIALQLMEELGEASDAMIRTYTYKEETFRRREPNWRQQNLEIQLADVFSRTFALVEKLNQLSGQDLDAEATEPIRLSQIIWRRYGSDDLRSFYCPFCKETVCRCPIVLVPGNRRIEELLEKYE